ncbi:hypothetical protein CWE22_11120 [Pseudidiomarina aestuarii]|uniref:Amidoligase enzyme n=1 Tax=Pseudidiomarina aestuarii TaxID=624146 RepID=A0A7Z6ZRU3_9GAMM|nr:amidoligase family protein [Pseudidiomarina aestuarii]RUO39024.1 hypothetical protein CWE22_11120 [Pseudidiomarina aestuarii]
MLYQQPQQLKTTQGKTRLVGFELEFAGLDLQQTIDVLKQSFQLDESSSHAAMAELHHSDLGTFRVEIDWSYLQRHAAEAKDTDMEALWNSISNAATTVVPIEIVCPPIAIDTLDILDGLVNNLREAGAKGTRESMLAAYGTHINVEYPSTDSVHAYLQAFGLLQWWLVEAHHVNNTRKLSPYIDLYPEDYVRRILKQSEPDINQVIDDYLAANPSRNRALDMLPAFMDLDEQRVRAAIDDEKVNARPTFHYRLPDCRIADAKWSLAKEWNLWCVVERLANDAESLDELAEQFLDAHRPLLGVNRTDWVKVIQAWHDRL